MKIELLFYSAVVFFGLTEPLIPIKYDKIQSNSIIIDSNQLNKNLNPTESNKDTFQVLVKIKASLPVAWGTKYKCKIVEIKKGELTGTDSCFLMSASNGSEEIFLDIHALKTCENYLIEFIKSKQLVEESFLPNGRTGFMDKNGAIWNINKVSYQETADESTFAVLAL